MNRSIGFLTRERSPGGGAAGRFTGWYDQCPSYTAPSATHRRKVSFCAGVNSLCADFGGITFALVEKMRRMISLLSGSPGTIGTWPLRVGRVASSRTSRPMSGLRALRSGPGQRKQVSDRMGRRSLLKLTRSDCAPTAPAEPAMAAICRTVPSSRGPPRALILTVLGTRSSAKFVGNRRNRTDFDVAIEHIRAFGLENEGSRSYRRRHWRIDPERPVQAHHDFSVDDVDAVFAECDQLDGVPFASRPLIVGLLDAAARCALALR